MTRIVAFVGVVFSCATQAQTPPAKLWSDLKTKREQLPGFHQEFEVSRTYKNRYDSQASKRDVVVDWSAGKWREQTIWGSGKEIQIFDGTDLLTTEEESDEYIRTKPKNKQTPLPGPYSFPDADWTKAKDLGTRPCGFAANDRPCVTLEAPLKRWTRALAPQRTITLEEGSLRVTIDMETGLVLGSRIVQFIDDKRATYVSESVYVLRRFSEAIPSAALFSLPPGAVRQVKQLSAWDAAKIKKQLAGKPAPELALIDMDGKTVTLSSFKGKTVLLDFFATWCPPCRADAPALAKLHQKYGGKDLAIVGISVSEDRSAVNTFLKKFPHGYPVALTSENEMPRTYQIGVFPTYIVIDADGKLASAVEGDQGLSELRSLLKKAGLDTD